MTFRPLRDRVLSGFMYAWIGVAILINIAAVAGVFLTKGFWATVTTLQEWFSPFNVANVFMEILLFSPALGAYWLRERLRQR